jgi:uncharacterized protein YndB with AHSA1/START domain
MKTKKPITVQTSVRATEEEAWKAFTDPKHITQWNFASDDWCCPAAENDAVSGGRFSWRMEAKDGSTGFDFEGVYDEVVPKKRIAYRLGDGREVRITFETDGENVLIRESFEAEGTNSDELQRAGWQAILDNFKRYVERGGVDK